MVATDGHRLALIDRQVAGGASDLTSGVILPRKGLAELKRLVDEEDADEIEIGIEGNSALVRQERRDAHDASHRGRVPELSPGACRRLRHGA